MADRRPIVLIAGELQELPLTDIVVGTEAEVKYDSLVDWISDDVFYFGQAAPGTITSAATWRVQRVSIAPGDGDTDARWADGTADFIKIWDDRATFTYI